ncbi:MAG TPA: cysteine desulfurase family protein [Thermoanaerobaculia bacterium]|nr:cysteine desulfurase family protein [Thermoanaerobaculia bacterium]
MTIYLDHHSTTPCDPRVLEKMLPFFSENFGNPSAVSHVHGRRAATAVENARMTLADLLGAQPGEVVFTAGATESNNIAIRGLTRGKRRHVITSAVEHKSVLEPVRRLRDEGIEVTVLPVDREGFVSPDALRAAIRDDTALVSIMAANGEIGTIQPLDALASICRDRGVPLHADATQAIGKIPLRLDRVPVDLLSLSAHKFYGPKGAGALLVRRGIDLTPLTVGGGQERGLRSGTLNVPAVIGMAEALDLAIEEMEREAGRLSALRDRLWAGLQAAVPDSRLNGPAEHRLPGNLNVTFRGVDAERLMQVLPGYSLSSGSACSSGANEPSHVLLEIGLTAEEARAAIRFGLGRGNTGEQIENLIRDLSDVVSSLLHSSERR